MKSRDEDGELKTRPLSAVGTSIQWFRDTLKQKGVTLNPASELLAALAHVDEFRGRIGRGDLDFKFDSSEAVVEHFTPIYGVDFLTKMVHRGQLAGLTIPDHRWQDFKSGDPLITRPATSSKPRNLVWELVLASAAATFAKNVTFDEPDIVCEFDGKRFGIAAKVVYRDKKMRDNVMKGEKQARGRVDASIVFVDVVGLVPLVEVYRTSREGKFGLDGEAGAWAKRWATHWCETEFPLERLASDIRDRAEHPMGVAFFFPLVLNLSDDGPVPFFYTGLPLMWGNDSVDGAFAKMFLHACNTVLGFEAN